MGWLQADNVVREVDGQRLLSNVSIALEPGQRTAVIGPTGSGKTLLLRSLALLDQVDAGTISWRGEPVRGDQVPRFRSRVIYLHQRPALPAASVGTILRQPYSLRIHREKKYEPKLVLALLKLLGRDESFLTKQQHELSGGERQLVAILRAVQLNPDVLLLDEPTSALDSESAGSVESLISCWLDEKPDARAAVWVTHDLDQARRVSSSVIEMRNGRLLKEAAR